ncbi:MAG TPA: YaiO family outer membrane beta-barrel protein [Nevskiaceae bacterium]|nr:YaiO family outer membrane beta-barrel protein [Nevskiaceae bacterium]
MWRSRIALLLLLVAPAASADADGRPRWTLDLDWITDEFSNARGGEQTAMTQLGYRFSRKVLAYLHYEWLHHFDAYDQKYAVGALFEPMEDLAVSLEAGWSDDPVFSADRSGQVRVDLVRWDVVQPSIAYRYLDYDGFGHVSTWTPGVRVLTPAGNLEFRDAFSRDIDGTRTSIRSLKLFWLTGSEDQLAFYVAGFDGEDSLPPQTRADFWRLMSGLSWILSREWEVRADFGWEKREASYIQRSFAFGLTRRF